MRALHFRWIASLLLSFTVALGADPQVPIAPDDRSLPLIPPWTPVKARTDQSVIAVDVWGRTLEFAHTALPSGIVTAGEEVLAAPIRLVGQVNGKPIDWKRTGAELFSQCNANAIVSSWQANDDLIANITTRAEFDGMMRVDLVIMPQKGATPKLDRLWLEVPLKRSRASLFHYWPGAWGAASNSGAVSESGMSIPFKPFVWLGWEAGGLGWFAESDQGWQPQDSQHSIEIIRNGEQTLLRLHLLDSPPPRLPLTFTFGFQATPVKPWRRDFHDLGVCHGAYYGMETRPWKPGAAQTVLEHAAGLGVKTLVFHQSWTPIQNYPVTTHETELRQLADACHQHGIKLLLYFGYELSTLAPEWAELSDEVLVKDTTGNYTGGYHRQPEQRDYIVCYASPWRKRWLEGIDQAVSRYGVDGVYLDGTCEPWACANEKHGCGYRTADGALHPTYPIFAVRKLMHGLAAFIHPRGGLINAHQSTCCLTPTLGFADSYWDGEQFDSDQLASDPLKILPLETFRAEFMGRNFGLPAEFLVHERPPRGNVDSALALTMLHDVCIRPGNVAAELEKIAPIWKVMSRFDVSGAEWHPYWEAPPLASAQPDTMKVSLYLHPAANGHAGRALIVVSNLSAVHPATAQVRLVMERLGIREVKAKDALTGESLENEAGQISVPLEPSRMRLVWVE